MSFARDFRIRAGRSPAILVSALTASLLAAAVRADAAMIVGTHPVLETRDGGVLLLNFNGLPIQVRMACIRMADGSLEKVSQMLKGQSVRIEYADELGCDDAGRPMVYVLRGGTVLNVELVRGGLASYDSSKARSQRYDEHLAAAEAAAKREKVGMWAVSSEAAGGHRAPCGEAGEGGGAAPAAPSKTAPAAIASAGGPAAAPAGAVYSELRSSQYHSPNCRYAKRIAANSLIVYASVEKAEQAGKHPCWVCFAERAEKSAFGAKEVNAAAAALGKLVGLKSDKLFHSPCCPRIRNAKREDIVGFQTLEEAQGSGRQACYDCLRLRTLPGAPPCPPEKGECIGRAPPYFRPCMRPAADASGLCSECQGR
jgi:endonuclease YncB( thermonuclease family)/methylphosphotriester-DNA--protein-cysteine methyltransferase